MEKRKLGKKARVGILIGILLLGLALIWIFGRGFFVRQILLSDAIESDTFSRILTLASRPSDVERVYYNDASEKQKERIITWLGYLQFNDAHNSNSELRNWASRFLLDILYNESESVSCRFDANAWLTSVPWCEGIASLNPEFAANTIAGVGRTYGSEVDFVPIAVARTAPVFLSHQTPSETKEMHAALLESIAKLFGYPDFAEEVAKEFRVSNGEDFGAVAQHHEKEGRHIEAMICYQYAFGKEHFKENDKNCVLNGMELWDGMDRMIAMSTEKNPAEMYRAYMIIANRYTFFERVNETLMYKRQMQVAFDRKKWYRAAVWAAAHLLCNPEDEEVRAILSTAMEHYRGQPLSQEEMSLIIDPLGSLSE